MRHDVRYQLDLRYGAVITLGVDDQDMPAYTIHMDGVYMESGNIEFAVQLRHVVSSCYRLMNRKITFKTRQFIRSVTRDMF
jgi:hypothetical protein